MGSATRPRAATRSHTSRLRLRLGIAVAAITAGSCVLAAPAFASPLSSGSSSDSSSGTNSGLDVSGVASKVDPGVVDINTTLANNGGAAAGTGLVISGSGQVLTNNHVIDNATTITVRVVGTVRTYTAEVIGYDIAHDIAVLQLRGASALRTITTARSPSVLIGEPVVAIGNALGKGGVPTATPGVVSAVDQTVTARANGQTAETLRGMIQTDAQIQPGDSGGPLVNADAQAIGMNTAASTSSGGLQQASPTAGFAIPIDTALSIAHQIEAGQATGTIHLGSRALLGVEVRDSPNTPGGSGALIIGIQPHSPAASLGLTAGDSVISLNGTPISTSSDLTAAIAPSHAGDTVTVGWIDTAGHQHSASVALIAGPPA
jgi:S1-C subfamily serine protease